MKRGRQAAHASQSADPRYLTGQVRITIVPQRRARTNGPRGPLINKRLGHVLQIAQQGI
jgi:hypothetical protein